MGLIEFWGAHRADLYDIMCESVDPEGRILAGVRSLCPWDRRLVMDIGCGRGDQALFMARDAEAVVAVDADQRMVERTRERASEARSSLCVLHADVTDLPLATGSLDAIYAFWAYFFGPGAEEGLAECERILRPGGTLCVVQNRGGDELSELWSDAEFACLQWGQWFQKHGFSSLVINSHWRFPSMDEAALLVQYLWGEKGLQTLLRRRTLQFGFAASIYCRRRGE